LHHWWSTGFLVFKPEKKSPAWWAAQRKLALKHAEELKNGPLPAGWEVGKADDGRVFFIEPTTMKSTWSDPRKSTETSKVTSVQAVVSNPAAATASVAKPSAQEKFDAFTKSITIGTALVNAFLN
jgi:hypothetical protein